MQTILSAKEIVQKTERLAHQIIENCFEEETIYVAGIEGNGLAFADRLASIISDQSDVKAELISIKVNKETPWSDPIEISCDKVNLKNGFIVLVDDVINSGKTMQYALVEFLGFPTKAIKTVALVDRMHRRFPIKADFVGLSLSTTLKNRVHVDMKANEEKAYLV